MVRAGYANATMFTLIFGAILTRSQSSAVVAALAMIVEKLDNYR